MARVKCLTQLRREAAQLQCKAQKIFHSRQTETTTRQLVSSAYYAVLDYLEWWQEAVGVADDAEVNVHGPEVEWHDILWACRGDFEPARSRKRRSHVGSETHPEQIPRKHFRALFAAAAYLRAEFAASENRHDDEKVAIIAAIKDAKLSLKCVRLLSSQDLTEAEFQKLVLAKGRQFEEIGREKIYKKNPKLRARHAKWDDMALEILRVNKKATAYAIGAHIERELVEDDDGMSPPDIKRYMARRLPRLLQILNSDEKWSVDEMAEDDECNGVHTSSESKPAKGQVSRNK